MVLIYGNMKHKLDMNDGDWFTVEPNVLDRILQTIAEFVKRMEIDWEFKHETKTYPSGRTISIIYRKS